MKSSHVASLSILTLLAMSGGCTPKETPPTGSPATRPEATAGSGPAKGAGERIKVGYVLHGLNDFTQVIKRGAEAAGKDLDLDVEVTGPGSGFKATEAQGIFESMLQKKKDGMVVLPMPGDVWVKPIKAATDQGVPVETANMTSPDSASTAWFGQDEYQSGVILATEMKKFIEASGKKSGRILVGICAPAVPVLQERYKGFLEGLKGSQFTATDAKDVTAENTTNYSAWENLATANPDVVAAVGLCSMDIPNLAKLKKRSGGKWLIGGYDLNPETLEAIKSGAVDLTLGQHPYLQGYLPVLAMAQHLRDKKPFPGAWVNVGTEIITKANVDSVIPRETDKAAEAKWYADYIKKNFADMAALAKPLPKTH